jgi:hypothetical protein
VQDAVQHATDELRWLHHRRHEELSARPRHEIDVGSTRDLLERRAARSPG